jgi:type VI secretion system VasD/TssJ family lipoprotein
MKSRFTFPGWSPFLLLLAATHCSSAQPVAKEPPPPCAPTKTVLTLAASSRVNADVSGEGRPVQVRVYLLKNDAHLKNARFEDVWEHDKEVLAEDFLKSDQYTLFPGESKRVVVNPTDDTRSIAAVGLFREPHDRSWFVAYDVDVPAKGAPCPQKDRAMSVWLDGMQIRDGEGESSRESPAVDERAKSDKRAAGAYARNDPAGPARSEAH